MDEPRNYEDLPKCPKCKARIGKPGVTYLADNPGKTNFCECTAPGTVGWLIENLKHLDPTMYVYMESEIRGASSHVLRDVSIIRDGSWEKPPTHEDHVVLS